MPTWFVFFPLLSILIPLSNQLPFSVDKAAKGEACSRNPQLQYCGEYRREGRTQITNRRPSKTIVLASRQRVEDVAVSKDQAACRELRVEYTKSCTRRTSENNADEFCSAYENVCLEIPRDKPEQQVVPKGDDSSEQQRERNKEQQQEADKITRSQTNSRKNLGGRRDFASFSLKFSDVTSNEDSDANHTLPPPGSRPLENPNLRTLPPTRRDYSEFCAEYKQRFLYVCPDPFRFGQRAVVFCPIYSDRCKLPVPEKPIVPTPQTPIRSIENLAQRMCGQYHNFAANYCGNPFALLQNNIREGCEKYRKFCVNNNSQRFG